MEALPNVEEAVVNAGQGKGILKVRKGKKIGDEDIAKVFTSTKFKGKILEDPEAPAK